MTLTKTQIFHRTESLSGEIKAAREAQSECRRALADQERLTTIAAQAVERADARVAELEAERADLAEQAHAAILQVGDPPPLATEDGPAPEMVVLNSGEQSDVHNENQQLSSNGLAEYANPEFQRVNVFSNEFYQAAMANGEAKVAQAFDEVTR